MSLPLLTEGFPRIPCCSALSGTRSPCTRGYCPGKAATSVIPGFWVSNFTLVLLCKIPIVHSRRGKAIANVFHQAVTKISKYILKQAQLSNIDNSTPLSATPTLNSILEPLMQKHIKGVISTSHTHLLLWLMDQLVQYTISPTELSQSKCVLMP